RAQPVEAGLQRGVGLLLRLQRLDQRLDQALAAAHEPLEVLRLRQPPLRFLVALVSLLDRFLELDDLIAPIVRELAQVLDALFLFLELGLEARDLLARLVERGLGLVVPGEELADLALLRGERGLERRGRGRGGALGSREPLVRLVELRALRLQLLVGALGVRFRAGDEPLGFRRRRRSLLREPVALGDGGGRVVPEPLELRAELGASLLELGRELGDACVALVEHVADALELRGGLRRAPLGRVHGPAKLRDARGALRERLREAALARGELALELGGMRAEALERLRALRELRFVRGEPLIEVRLLPGEPLIEIRLLRREPLVEVGLLRGEPPLDVRLLGRE